MNILLNTLLGEYQDKIDTRSNFITRSLELKSVENKVTVAIGMRRVGKTTAMFNKILELTNNNEVSFEQIFYLNLEDDRLMPFSTKQLSKLVDDFYTLYPDNHNSTLAIFNNLACQ